jgi:hypothetical protein
MACDQSAGHKRLQERHKDHDAWHYRILADRFRLHTGLVMVDKSADESLHSAAKPVMAYNTA